MASGDPKSKATHRGPLTAKKDVKSISISQRNERLIIRVGAGIRGGDFERVDPGTGRYQKRQGQHRFSLHGLGVQRSTAEYSAGTEATIVDHQAMHQSARVEGMVLEAEADFDHRLLAEPGRAISALDQLGRELVTQGLMFGDSVIPTSLKPYFVASAVHDAWVQASERLIALLENVARLFVEDRELYALLGLPPGGRDLIDIAPGYSRIAVLSRPDAVHDDTRLRFLEINSDSPAMMTIADRIQRIQSELFPVVDLADRWNLSYSTRTPRLLEALLDCYREWRGGTNTPTIAIVDWRGEKTSHELQRAAEEFTRLGSPTLVADPRDLSLKNGRLMVSERSIDLVYRRVLFTDFLERRDELAPLLEAYRRGAVCMVNPLRSYVVGSKALLALLHSERLKTYFSPMERELVSSVVPPTWIVDEGIRRRLRHERTGWVLKKAESHGGHHVLIGPLTADAQWEAALAETGTEIWVAQQLEPIPRYRLPQVNPDGGVTLSERFINWNPFLFGGRYAGGITRASDSMLINICQGGALLPTAAVSSRAAAPLT